MLNIYQKPEISRSIIVNFSRCKKTLRLQKSTKLAIHKNPVYVTTKYWKKLPPFIIFEKRGPVYLLVL